VINDSWTPSGEVHIGSLKGPVIHDVLYKILKEKGIPVFFRYGFDDYDPIDGLPPNLLKSHSSYFGVPLSNAPAPFDEKGSFAEFFAKKMQTLLEKLGVKPDELYRTSNLYKSGRFDEAIRIVLDKVEKVREVYEKIYEKRQGKDWYPLQVVCPKCRKVGTTKVVGWDGEKVKFVCLENLVEWAKGCGYKGEISPFGGNAKMPFKVEWAAKWALFGVTIETAGKDHASAGGSYDVATKIVEEVFEKPAPKKLGYEFFLVGGKKMSSSKGLGITGEELLEIVPAELARFLMIKTDPAEAVDFDIKGTYVIPKLYDDYQRFAEAYFSHKSDDYSLIFKLSAIKKIKKPPVVRFSTLVQWVQMPNMEEEIRKNGAEDWAKYARVWVEKYAPDKDRFIIQKNLPEAVNKLSDKQKRFLLSLSKKLESANDPSDLQRIIYELSEKEGIPSKDAFSAIYISFLGKTFGPKVGPLIFSLEKEFAKQRLSEASRQ